MSKKLGVVTLVIAIIALLLSIVSIVLPPKAPKQDDGDIQYVLYLGTNDKDTYQPYGTPDEVKSKVDEVLTKHVEGFTIQEANGGWTNEDGTVDHEYTVVIILSDVDDKTVHETANDLVKEFNQTAIMIQANKTKTEFYYGE
jgi:hypothetical protein